MALAETKPFDRDAQARMAALFRTCPPVQFLSELDSYVPRPGPELVTFHKFRGWALYDAGDYGRARPHLLRALRWSDGGSNERSLVHGLLAESYLRLGELHRAERCTRRALSEGCGKDRDHFIHAGHLLALGRIQALSGHLAHALDTLSRALALVNERSPHWIPILMAIAQVHLHGGRLQEAEAAIHEARRGPLGGKQQGWVIASVESPLAIAVGDIDRADWAVREAARMFFNQSGERVQLLLNEFQASVLHARGRYQASEELLRGILTRSVLSGRNSDAVVSASRGLTESLMAQDRFEEALEVVQLAIRAGSMDDRAEWVTALRLKGECLCALGATGEAQRAFREAMSAHACTQFDVERARTERSIRGAAFRGSVSVEGVPWTAVRGNASRRLELRSGRVFLSGDARLIDAIRTAASTDLPVLVEGETGTGKELVANLIHELGPRSKGPMVVVDCTSLPESLADVELFGATRGAYTGAFQERAGLIAQANGGTLLLDELPQLTTALQAKLLRVIQEGTYRRLGEDRLRRVGVRFVATTNLSVQRLLDMGTLRLDLFHRLSGHRLTLRPLRSRREEIGPLASEIAMRSGLGGIMRDAVELLESQPWPGNVRQLEMVVRLAAASCRPSVILRRVHLQPHLAAEHYTDPTSAVRGATLRASRAAAERAVLEKALADSGGVVAQAARSLGISRQSFYKAMRRTGLDPG